MHYLKLQYLQRLIPHLHESAHRLNAERIIKAIKQTYYRTSAMISLARKFPQFLSDAELSIKELQDSTQKITQLSALAIDQPTLIPQLVRILEEYDLKDIEEHYKLSLISPPSKEKGIVIRLIIFQYF